MSQNVNRSAAVELTALRDVAREVFAAISDELLALGAYNDPALLESLARDCDGPADERDTILRSLRHHVHTLHEQAGRLFAAAWAANRVEV